ncbi:hypothetical protein CAXC1_260060 [Candidatus Xenohaliotis californiensis]|uniref:Resolvase/invertase-type recombinase catalytic domain-containing protein n=1 Tax=Candidatus Xenohaliotis californiensis TaxID=84677 RepID=A0ABM9N878_9RICK|nr:hypothetical protein CAXC1_260060 [Candidatus Xenohaliotis californiensis]
MIKSPNVSTACQGRLLGYAPVSKQNQDLTTQIRMLTKEGCVRIFRDRISGAKYKKPGLDQLLDTARENDVVVTHFR